ncbi:hypothetical protein F5883DRAFT_581091 [Diaporthe sp. PMI_573]|nr:hypothetical protein F5883DRAFT_581091 [Diaporthaceae sp. PMI_573]
MTSPCPSKRHDDPAERIYKRLGVWPKLIFDSRGRSELCPSKWSIGLLDSLSALTDYFDKFDRAQGHPGSAPPRATTRQQAKASADNSKLKDRIALALIEEIDTRIQQKTKTRRKGSVLVAHPPKRTYLTPHDIQAVRDKHEVSRKGSSHVSEEYEDAEEDDGGRVIVGEDEGRDDREEGAEYSSEDQHAEGEEDLDPPQNEINGQRNEVNSLLASPSSSAALVGTVPPKTKNHDQNVAPGGLAGKASLSAPVNTGSTSAARTNLNLKALTHATGNDGSENVNGTSLRSTRHAQPSSPHALPAAPTPSPMPRQLTSLASLHRHEWSEQSSFVPNKRPRLSGHCNGNSRSTDEAGSGDAETDLANNDNGHGNTYVVDTSSERHFGQQNLQLGGDSSLIHNIGELSALEAIRQQSVHFAVSAAELQVTISRQSALNAADKETIAKAGECSEKISEFIGLSSRKLADLRSTIKVIHGFTHENEKTALLAQIEGQLGHLQEKWRFSEQERATALDRHDQRVKAALTTVTQHENAVKRKKYWDLVSLATRMEPERLQQVVGSHPVVAEYWRAPTDSGGEDRDACELPPLQYPRNGGDMKLPALWKVFPQGPAEQCDSSES